MKFHMFTRNTFSNMCTQFLCHMVTICGERLSDSKLLKYHSCLQQIFQKFLKNLHIFVKFSETFLKVFSLPSQNIFTIFFDYFHQISFSKHILNTLHKNFTYYTKNLLIFQNFFKFTKFCLIFHKISVKFLI